MARSMRARASRIDVRHWRKHLRKLQPRRTCAQCGFLAYGEGEASHHDRVRLGGGYGSGVSPSGPAERWKCAKGLWLWELVYVQPDWGVIFDEVTKDRRGCGGFRRWRPGRSPAQHVELEDKSVDFRRQLILAVMPKAMAICYGLLVALIGSILVCYWVD